MLLRTRGFARSAFVMRRAAATQRTASAELSSRTKRDVAHYGNPRRYQLLPTRVVLAIVCLQHRGQLNANSEIRLHG
jgi:hypothetical protein